jgi:MFS family permease
MIPPIYILAAMFFADVESRARAFGVISGMGGIGAAAGPLVGGLITTAISWRASFLLQAAIVALIIVLSRRLSDPVPPDRQRRFDGTGAALSAAGMLFIVPGLLGRQRLGAVRGVPRDRRRPPGVVLHLRSVLRARAESRCCPRACSPTARRTSQWSPRTSSGCCRWGRHSS